MLTETIKGDGAGTNVTTYGYNPDGQIAHITDPLGQTFDYTYDDDNRLSSILMKDAQQTETTKTIAYSWDTTNKTQLWTVSVGNDSVEIKYNEYGLLDYVDGVLPAGTGGDPDKVTYGYDADYRLSELGYAIFDSEVGESGEYVIWTTSYAYDTFGRLDTIEDRLGLTTEYAYNDDHTLKSLTLPNGTVTEYTYDDLRRLVSIATTGLSANDVIVKFTYQYNELGLRDKVTMADGRTVEWDYDDVGRLVEEHFKSAGPSPTTLLRYVYAYDAAGNRTSKKTDYDDNPNNGYAATATYTNNGYNQLTAVSGSPGRGTRVNVTGTIPTAWTVADGDVTVTPNEGDPVPAEVRGRFFVARNVPLQDGDNTLVASTTATTLAGNEPTSDTVDDVELDASLDQEYTYNANGNLIQKTEDVNGTTIQWDYTYSVDGWLTKVEKNVGGQSVLVEEYFYDPVGRKYKVVATAGGATTRYFAYDGGSIVLELEEDSGDYLLEKEHIRGLSLGGGIGGLLYTRSTDGSVGYFHYDGRGNVVSVTDESRTQVAYYEYDAWGNTLTACGNLANEFKFSTKQASTGTGLVDFGYRLYDPPVGRWTRRDPLGIQGGLNSYSYVTQDPINSFDPWGLKQWTETLVRDLIRQKAGYPEECMEQWDLVEQAAIDLFHAFKDMTEPRRVLSEDPNKKGDIWFSNRDEFFDWFEDNIDQLLMVVRETSVCATILLEIDERGREKPRRDSEGDTIPARGIRLSKKQFSAPEDPRDANLRRKKRACTLFHELSHWAGRPPGRPVQESAKWINDERDWVKQMVQNLLGGMTW